jgi:hypothetical protein
MSPIHTDGALLNEYPDAIDGDDAIMNAFMTDPEEGDDAASKKKKPSEKVEEDEETNQPDADDEEASEETPEEETDEDAEEEGQEDDKSEDEDKPSKKYADDNDDTYVKVKVGDKEEEVKVNDLKRLYGQEASLTRKSQEVAEIRKTSRG